MSFFGRRTKFLAGGSSPEIELPPLRVLSKPPINFDEFFCREIYKDIITLETQIKEIASRIKENYEILQKEGLYELYRRLFSLLDNNSDYDDESSYEYICGLFERIEKETPSFIESYIAHQNNADTEIVKLYNLLKELINQLKTLEEQLDEKSLSLVSLSASSDSPS